MSVRPIDVAVRLKLHKATITTFIKNGMPLTTMEDAEAWYRTNVNRRKQDEPEPYVKSSAEGMDDANLEEIIDDQKKAKKQAFDEYMKDLKESNPAQSKSYATYDKILKRLMELEDRLHNRRIAAKEYIKTQTAIERFGKVILAIRNDLIQLETKLAAKANPDSPRTAQKAIGTEINRILLRISGMADEACDIVEVGETPKVIEMTDDSTPDETTDENEPTDG